MSVNGKWFFHIQISKKNRIKVLKVRCVGYAVQDLKICGLKTNMKQKLKKLKFIYR